MPNIGKELEKRLINAGIINAIQLKEIGSAAAFHRIYSIDHGICINMLYALEGAIQDIRWHKLDKNTKQELRYYYNKIKTTNQYRENEDLMTIK